MEIAAQNLFLHPQIMSKTNNDYAVGRNVTLSLFLLMFGYKLFSAYFPLFLAARGMSLAQVGYSYLLIYLPIALLAPPAGFLCRKTNPAGLMTIGIAGYAAYALAMIFTANSLLFYIWQAILGISAALFYTSSRYLLMEYPQKNIEREFSWFYNASIWADVAAPAAGAILLWQTNFTIIFLAAFFIQALAAVFALKLWNVPHRSHANFNLLVWISNWKKIFVGLKQCNVAIPLLISFVLLWQAGLSAAFFMLFLKNGLLWSNNKILLFAPLSAAVFLVAYFIVIRPLQKDKNTASIAGGSLLAGLAALFFALPRQFLNFASIFAINFAQSAGTNLAAAGRSALLTRHSKKVLAEAGALDTMFSPLGTALGSLTAGLLVGYFGYQQLFFWGGIVLITVVCISMALFANCQKKKNIIE